jgi:hypothetical protein
MKWLGIMLMAALLAIAPGYGWAVPPAQGTSAPPPPQGAGVKAEPAAGVKSYTPKEREAYENKTAADLDELQNKISELRLKATTGAPQKKRMIVRAAKNLQIRAIVARNQLDALQKAPPADWTAAKANLDKSMEDLKKYWASVEVHLK